MPDVATPKDLVSQDDGDLALAEKLLDDIKKSNNSAMNKLDFSVDTEKSKESSSTVDDSVSGSKSSSKDLKSSSKVSFSDDVISSQEDRSSKDTSSKEGSSSKDSISQSRENLLDFSEKGLKEMMENVEDSDVAQFEGLIDEAMKAEETEQQLDKLLTEKKKELTQLKLARQALEEDCYEELELAFSLTQCLEQGDDGEFIIPQSELQALGTIAEHLIGIPFIRNEVLAHQLPRILDIFPKVSDADLTNDTLLSVILQMKNEEQIKIRMKRLEQVEDNLLLGIHRPDLLHLFEFKEWADEHFLILAEASHEHAKYIASRLEGMPMPMEKKKASSSSSQKEDEEACCDFIDTQDISGKMSEHCCLVIKQLAADFTTEQLEKLGKLYVDQEEEITEEEKNDEDRIDTPLLMKKKLNYLTRLQAAEEAEEEETENPQESGEEPAEEEARSGEQ